MKFRLHESFSYVRFISLFCFIILFSIFASNLFRYHRTLGSIRKMARQGKLGDIIVGCQYIHLSHLRLHMKRFTILLGCHFHSRIRFGEKNSEARSGCIIRHEVVSKQYIVLKCWNITNLQHFSTSNVFSPYIDCLYITYYSVIMNYI